MTPQAYTLIEEFERLPREDQVEVAREIFRRTVDVDYPLLTDEGLSLIAEEAFLELDRREIEDEPRNPR